MNIQNSSNINYGGFLFYIFYTSYHENFHWTSNRTEICFLFIEIHYLN
jgi:hypothetical protein